MNSWLPGGKDGRRDSWGLWDGHVHTTIFKVDHQQRASIWHRGLCSVLCGSLDGKGVWGRMDICKCMTELLCSPPETITTFLIHCSESRSVVLTLCNPTDSTVHGILQAKILEWVAFPFSRGSSQPRDRKPWSPTLQMDSYPAEPPGNSPI